MMLSRSYRNALIAAIFFHIAVAVVLFSESSSTRPVLELATQNQETKALPTSTPQAETIKAVSVDNQEVMETVNRLKNERLKQKQAEDNRQQALVQQAEAARKKRVQEQQHLEKLKDEAAKLALAQEKKLAEDQRKLKELAKQKDEEEKHLADMKQKQVQLQKQQKEEADKLAELKKKKEEEAATAKTQKDKALAEAKAKALAEQKKQASAEQAARQAEQNSQLAGEVDKYKALIINAISRQWILPENVAGGVSSQFRIRLAPDGGVLEVTLTRSSGDPILDRSAQSAIYKASPLPVPSDPAAFDVFRDISLTVRPENAKG